ncbi:MAG: hypothetical protein A3E85_02010 [Gammaproteobacteria bacterium RIFCSPHIGHO2_12_FULL_45_12]|nr:MAG: hypothetical protein A3E85_02010 [Gammaproteobacteria bacterium RIFCSPHIGHO2_12_FULL_45_12]
MHGLFQRKKQALTDRAKKITQQIAQHDPREHPLYVKLTSPDAKRRAFGLLEEASDGAAVWLNLSRLHSLAPPKQTFNILTRGFCSSAVYMGYVLLGEGLKQLIRGLPYLSAARLDEVLEAIIDLYVMNQSLRYIWVDGAAYGMTLYHVTGREKPVNEHMQGCDCRGNKTAGAGIVSTIYYQVNLGVLAMLSSAFGLLFNTQTGRRLPLMMSKSVGAALFVSRALVYGRGLLEYPLADAGICLEHQQETLNKNYSFSLGLGLSFLGLVWFMETVMRQLTRSSSSLLYDAIFAFMFQYFIVMVMLINKPLPGKFKGPDVFAPTRAVVDKGLEVGLHAVLLRLARPEYRTGWRERIDFVTTLPPVRWLGSVFLRDDLNSLSKIVRRPAVSVVFELHAKKIQAILEWVKWVQELKYVDFAQSVLYWLPYAFVSEKVRNQLKLVLNANTKRLVKSANDFMIEELAWLEVTQLEASQQKIIREFVEGFIEREPETVDPDLVQTVQQFESEALHLDDFSLSLEKANGGLCEGTGAMPSKESPVPVSEAAFLKEMDAILTGSELKPPSPEKPRRVSLYQYREPAPRVRLSGNLFEVKEDYDGHGDGAKRSAFKPR